MQIAEFFAFYTLTFHWRCRALEMTLFCTHFHIVVFLTLLFRAHLILQAVWFVRFKLHIISTKSNIWVLLQLEVASNATYDIILLVDYHRIIVRRLPLLLTP